MRITFVLPGYLSYPSGGFKVVYEYANHLSARGHQLTLVHPRTVQPSPGFVEWGKAQLWPYRMKWRDRVLAPWHELQAAVHISLVADLREKFIPPADAIFATGYRTAPWVNNYNANKGRKYYLIQHHETWDGPAAEVNQTWRLPLHKIVIAQWLLKLAQQFGEAARVTYIPNGLDFSRFGIDAPIAARPPLRVGMMAHSFVWKGTADGIAALTAVKEKLPALQAVFFGVHPRPAEAPAWIEYQQQPSATQLRALYNSCAVFLHPSWTEGWGLPAAEAMACGCALVAADSQGVREFAATGENALLAPPNQPAMFARSMLEVLENTSLRHRLAKAGHKKIQEFTWEKSVNALEELLLTCR